ncbi:MAG: hypothetical protein Q6M04_07485 [Thermostichus sp. BF3_bins_97]
MSAQNPRPHSFSLHEADALSDDQLEEISGGIIVVGGLPSAVSNPFTNVALNPQPLPPRFRLFNIFRF